MNSCPSNFLSGCSAFIYGPKLSQLPTSNFSKVKATTVVVAVRDHEEEEVGTNPYEEGASYVSDILKS